jgi:hypothetical protein
VNEPRDANSSKVTLDATGDDSALLALERQFNEITADLLTAQRANEVLAACPIPRRIDAGANTKQVEAILERLYPIERAIMQTPACTIAGLAVKALHAAHVMSQYWEAPIDRIDWDAQVMRLLIEAVCDFANRPLLFRNLKGDE